MPRRKPVEAESTPAVPVSNAVESKTTPRKAAPKARSTAAHKHHAKINVETTVEAPVEQTAATVTHEAIASLAYSFWEARGFQGGSPDQDWLRAERELLKLA